MKTSNFYAFFKKHIYLNIFLLILIFWFILFLTSGSLFSGYHFMDDHEIVHINYNFKTQNMSLIEVFRQWLVNDISAGRFRPFYYIHRIVQTKMLGINFASWSIYTGLLGVFTTFLLFIFGRLIKFSIGEALLFSFLTTLGTQSAVWWQLGPAETIGTFLMSAALVLAVLSEMSTRHKIIAQTLFIMCILIMSLSKESFILIIPALAFVKIWISCELWNLSWIQGAKKNFLSLVVLTLIFGAEILYIKFHLGLTPDIEYAGIDTLNIYKIISTTKSLSQAGFWWIALVNLIAVILLRIRIVDNSTKTPFSRLSVLYFSPIFFLLVAVPQILLYAKSGISQRYLLPGILGYPLLMLSIYRYLGKNHRLVNKFILLLITISLSFKISLAWNAAQTFALEGKSTNALLRTIEANTIVNSPILIVTNPRVYYEWNFSIKKYLNYVAKRSNLYLVKYSKIRNKFSSKLEKFYDFKILDEISNKQEVRCIVIFPELKRIFLKKSSNWFVKNNFEEYELGNFNRNLNKNSKMYLYCKKGSSKSSE